MNVALSNIEFEMMYNSIQVDTSVVVLFVLCLGV